MRAFAILNYDNSLYKTWIVVSTDNTMVNFLDCESTLCRFKSRENSFFSVLFFIILFFD